MQSRNSKNRKGIDVSHHNGTIDFNKVKSAGYDFVYIKLTEGTTFVDKKADTNFRNAKNAGMDVGFYHFARFTSNATAQAEARHFLKQVAKYDVDLPHCLDLEVNPGKLKPAFLSQAVLAYKALVGEIILYSGAYFARDSLTSAVRGIPLWVAHYGKNTPLANSTWSKWFMFQHTDTGRVNGISGNVDLNEMDTSVYTLKKSSNKTGTVKKETETTKTTVGTKTITIVSGDTLSELAVAYKTNVATLKDLNNLKSDTIYVGQKLKVPSSEQVKATPKATTSTKKITIKSGDTLSELAQKHNTTVAKLKDLNGLKNDTIYAGNTLKVPTTAPKGDQNTDSLVDYLKSIGTDSSFANREKLAKANGIKNYDGSADQNVKLLKALRGH